MMSDLKVKPDDENSMRKFLVLFHGPKDSKSSPNSFLVPMTQGTHPCLHATPPSPSLAPCPPLPCLLPPQKKPCALLWMGG